LGSTAFVFFSVDIAHHVPQSFIMNLINRAPLTAHDLHSIFGSQAKVPPYFAAVGVCTDTRTMQPGTLFVALRGERFDAHDHIYDAMVRGAAGIVIEERWLPEWEKTLGKEFPSFARVVVPDTLHALAELARYHRRRFSIPVIAVGGANGKTTTKDMIAHILGESFTTLKTQANNNNRVGTPLTLLQLTARTQAAVIEIGTNEPGEIEVLSAMVEPTHALITNIGEEHLEKLGDIDGVEKEETALFRWAMNHGAAMIVNADDDRLRSYASHQGAMSFATQRADAAASSNDVYAGAQIKAELSFSEDLTPQLTLRTGNEQCEANLSATGYAAALNAVAAVATCIAAGVPAKQALERCAGFVPDSSHGYARMVVERCGPWVVLNDCYNANPASMRMALQTLRGFSPAARRVAVIGDMRELGAAEERAHAEIVNEAGAGVDMVIAVGKAMATACSAVGSSAMVYANTDECVANIRAHLHEGDVVLVKASRGMKFEAIIAALR
jgi:UDP-N-acetylmuramoyl-tripeptide--D-alanyl-D-alanine ligase